MKKTSFLDKYQEISSSNDFKGKFNKSAEKVCKFCSKSSTETAFTNIPHVIPELLGRNNYTSNEECDTCNELFGKFETDLANYISPYQTLIGQKTKKKVPSFQSRKKRNEKPTTIKYVDGKPNICFKNNLSDFQYDYDNKLLSVSLKKKKFVPINVYKSLVKIGLSLCPKNELNEFKRTIEWLSINDNSKNITYDIPLILYRTRFSSKYYSKPFATLYKRKSEITKNIYEPKLCVVIYSGVLVFQLFIPFCIEIESIHPENYQLVNELYPAFMLDIDFNGREKINVKTSELPIIQYDMNYYEQVEENELIGFKYKSIERTQKHYCQQR